MHNFLWSLKQVSHKRSRYKRNSSCSLWASYLWDLYCPLLSFKSCRIFTTLCLLPATTPSPALLHSAGHPGSQPNFSVSSPKAWSSIRLSLFSVTCYAFLFLYWVYSNQDKAESFEFNWVTVLGLKRSTFIYMESALLWNTLYLNEVQITAYSYPSVKSLCFP